MPSLNCSQTEKGPLSKRLACVILEYMQNFTVLLHLFFCIALISTVLATLTVFFSEIYQIFSNAQVANSIMHALGTLLILWTLSELLNSEMKHLQGEHIQVTIFIEVAIAAMVRKLLILSSEGITLTEGSIYLASLLVLGLVHWFMQTRNIVIRSRN